MNRPLRRALPIALLLLPVLAQAAPLRVVMDENYPPFVYRKPDGTLEGYTVDIWRLWQKKTGVEVELVAVKWADVQPTLLRGQADVIDPIFRTETRLSTLDFTQPYGTVSTAIYADATIAGIHDIASLKDFEVAVQAADACAEQLQRAGVGELRIFPSYQALLDAAASQRVKLFCLDQYSADFHLYRLGLQRRYVKAFEVKRDELRRAVRKGDEATLALVERGMARITPAEAEALHNKWMGRPLLFTRYAERLVEALLALAILILLLGFWLRSVRRAVRTRTAELEREKAQLRTLVESSPDLIWLKDAAGVYRACNAGTAALFGRPREEIIGRTDHELFEAHEADHNRSHDAAALAAGRPLRYDEQVAMPGARGVRMFETIKTPVVKPDGTILGVLGVARDITERRQQEQTIHEQERLLSEMSSLARIGAWELDPGTGAFQWTDEVAHIYDFPPSQPFTPEACLSCYTPEGRAALEGALDAAWTRGEPFSIELEMVDGAGHHKWLRSICGPVIVDGRIVKLRGTVQDVTQRRDLEESMRMANLIYQTSSEAIVVTDEANHVVDANPAFTEQTGYRLPDVLGAPPPMFDSSMHDGRFYDHMWQELMANDHWQGEIQDRNRDGSFTAKFVNIRVIRHPDGRIYRHVIQFNDISERKQKDELIWRHANFDVLTGLPNRRLFFDRLEQDLKKAHGAGRGLGVLLVDLDRFKEINDSIGHLKGDSALIGMTRRLADCIPEDATLARLGGNTFALVVSEFDGRPHLETTAEAVIRAVAQPLQVGPDDVVHVSASVGISVYPEDGNNAADLVRNAEHAVYLAKAAGRGGFQYFTPSLQQQAQTKLMLTNDLREALARQQLQVHYQPIVDVATGRIRKAEVLLRWFHPGHGMVSPARFIPLAEETGFIDEICAWMLDEAIASIERWRDKYGCVVELSINISPVQFQRRGQLPWLDRIVNASLPPNSITVELTEGVLVSDAEQVTRCIGTLHAVGARVSIDDFGTGFSALSYLKNFEVDYLKIDKSFINHVTENGSDKALTEAIVDMAHRLGIAAIAEGVENRAQRDVLAAVGCDFIQGFFYSPAVTAENFEHFLEREPGVAAACAVR
ncbi:EAL domain-containing protein [Massilia niastensis]|uniref:EAL domain-containing protein n=1 Tax=Massilia niastensis TaxID=544911 RepID=UPI000A07B753|nr:EAL domain-containing protein [Massilia niastensis]